VIVHYHSLREEAGTKQRSRRSSLAADLVIANSKATALSVRGSKPLVVYPGVAIHPRTGTSTTGQFTIGVAARLAPVKGISFLIGAVALLREKIPHLRLVIAGDGPERPKLETQVRASGLEKAVRFAGWIDDVAAELSSWDLYVQPSLAEGLGISVLEAMAAGIPVVASDVGGLKEVIDDGATGFLIPPRDTGTLATKIERLASDATLRAKMGEAARAHVIEHFNLERESQAIRTAYEKLLA
jgi:glycosyltransferase involved in cell wall biosynthesis